MTEYDQPQAASPETASPTTPIVENSAAKDAESSSPVAAAESAAPSAAPAKKYQSLDPRNITVERIVGAIVNAVLTGGSALGFGIWLLVIWPPNWIYFVSLAGLLVLLGLLYWAFYAIPVLDHRHASWRVDEDGLEIRRGILWRREITVPRARVQHTDVHQGPLQRRYGIAKLVVHTAGTQAASVDLTGLAYPTAIWLRDTLIAELREHDDAV
jgi:membrane protein YdbS with pleckstrin-like domain